MVHISSLSLKVIRKYYKHVFIFKIMTVIQNATFFLWTIFENMVWICVYVNGDVGY